MFSMKFTKTKEASKVLTDSKLREEGAKDEEDEKDFVTSVDKEQIHGTKKKVVKKELVIPLIAKNEWRLGKEEEQEQDKDKAQPKATLSLSLEQQAIQELLGEALNGKGPVPLLLQNQVPKGYEEDDGALNVSLRAEPSTLEDYEKVPIEEFGMAMLRGMGWSKKEGIGLRNKQHVEMLEPQLRPKGLGLGASISSQAKKDVQNSHQVKEEEELVFKIGGGAVLLKGPDKGMYGRIEAFDEDNNRVVVKLAINGKMSTVSKFHINLVSEKDYKTKSKVLNYDQYAVYKEKQEAKEKDHRIKDPFENSEYHEDNKKKDKEQRSEKHYSDKRKENSKGKYTSSSSNPERFNWVRPHLKVRFIDKRYKHGKYYEKKFVVDDVIEEDRFVLRSESGSTLLEDISSSQLETVIPKDPHSAVCILSGKQKGRVGELIERNRSKETAIIKIPDGGVYELSYEQVCEFVGDPEDYY